MILSVVAVAVGCAASPQRVADRPEPAVEVAHSRVAVEPRSIPDEDRRPPRVVPPLTTYVVVRGDTLSSIARRHETTVGEIAALNHLSDPDELQVGQQLRLPGHDAAAPTWLWPVPGGSILSAFGAPRRNYRHEGLDIGAGRGQPVVAAESGRVVYSGSGMRGYGKTIILDHGDGITSLYAHNSSLLVRRGERVTRGQQVARVGRTGNASGEHCHVEIRRNDVPVDPLLYIKARGTGR